MAKRNKITGLMIANAFIADPNSINRLQGGRQIDWAHVSDDFLNERGVKRIPAGTSIGDALDTDPLTKMVSPRVDTTNPAIGILETEAVEDDTSQALSGFGIIVGGVLLEDMMPDATAGVLDADIKDELEAAGCQFTWQTYGSDSRVPA